LGLAQYRDQGKQQGQNNLFQRVEIWYRLQMRQMREAAARLLFHGEGLSASGLFQQTPFSKRFSANAFRQTPKTGRILDQCPKTEQPSL
jgi:hypothetical protein